MYVYYMPFSLKLLLEILFKPFQAIQQVISYYFIIYLTSFRKLSHEIRFSLLVNYYFLMVISKWMDDWLCLEYNELYRRMLTKRDLWVKVKARRFCYRLALVNDKNIASAGYKHLKKRNYLPRLTNNVLFFFFYIAQTIIESIKFFIKLLLLFYNLIIDDFRFNYRD